MKRGSNSAMSDALTWANGITQQYEIILKNWTTNWQDGKAFTALAYHFAPDKIVFPPPGDVPPAEVMDKAFEVLLGMGVPKLLDGEDIVEVADSKSIATYVMGAYSALSGQSMNMTQRAMSAPVPRKPTRKNVKPPTKAIVDHPSIVSEEAFREKQKEASAPVQPKPVVRGVSMFPAGFDPTTIKLRSSGSKFASSEESQDTSNLKEQLENAQQLARKLEEEKNLLKQELEALKAAGVAKVKEEKAEAQALQQDASQVTEERLRLETLAKKLEASEKAQKAKEEALIQAQAELERQKAKLLEDAQKTKKAEEDKEKDKEKASQQQASELMAERLRLEALEKKFNEIEQAQKAKEKEIAEAQEELELQKQEFLESSQKYHDDLKRRLEEELLEAKRETNSSLTVERLRLSSLEETLKEKAQRLEAQEIKFLVKLEAFEREKKEGQIETTSKEKNLEIEKLELERITKEEKEIFEKQKQEFLEAKKEEWKKIEEARKQFAEELQQAFAQKLEEEREKLAENFEKQLEWNKKKIKADIEKEMDTREHRQKLALNRESIKLHKETEEQRLHLEVEKRQFEAEKKASEIERELNAANIPEQSELPEDAAANVDATETEIPVPAIPAVPAYDVKGHLSKVLSEQEFLKATVDSLKLLVEAQAKQLEEEKLRKDALYLLIEETIGEKGSRIKAFVQDIAREEAEVVVEPVKNILSDTQKWFDEKLVKVEQGQLKQSATIDQKINTLSEDFSSLTSSTKSKIEEVERTVARVSSQCGLFVSSLQITSTEIAQLKNSTSEIQTSFSELNASVRVQRELMEQQQLHASQQVEPKRRSLPNQPGQNSQRSQNSQSSQSSQNSQNSQKQAEEEKKQETKRKEEEKRKQDEETRKKEEEKKQAEAKKIEEEQKRQAEERDKLKRRESKKKPDK
eukprot:TRINITY_DN915_c0_g1_i5.p1 TRINITY_DN915_c0_g1~~TRINITY_DN915_c0_g1_i5.p1  ORF type:complete len:920 (+),score=371.84 TRINITY_DN915_c0_g1_i5:24-2783(+)